MDEMKAPQKIRRLAGRGDGKLGCILWLAVLGYALFVGWQVVPAKIQSVELKNFMRQNSERVRGGQAQLKWYRKTIMDRAAELEIPLENENLIIKRSARRMRTQAKYTVPIDLLVYTWEWEIELDTETPVFGFSG